MRNLLTSVNFMKHIGAPHSAFIRQHWAIVLERSEGQNPQIRKRLITILEYSWYWRFTCLIVGGLFLLSSFQSGIDAQSRLALGTTDIFTHFNKLGEINKLPAFEDLEKMALQLFQGYTSSQTQHCAMHNPNGESESGRRWCRLAPSGRVQ